MPKYRIVIETQANGKSWYYVQCRYWIFFWKHLFGCKVGWPTIEEAEAYLAAYKEKINCQSDKRIVERGYIYQ
jgi:hypothetical protein